jgi:hypothetical protein
MSGYGPRRAAHFRDKAEQLTESQVDQMSAAHEEPAERDWRRAPGSK